ncbi:YciI family protein [Sorangium sp. So ce861]|uniref:YciI family protein n=1 Tax=Sorangium sp. So ce861 TaxID=3133323 RepID=UPI003F60AC00
MNEFMYLFRGSDVSGSPAEMQQHMGRWTAWVKELTEKGHLKRPGSPLEPTGKVIQGKQKAVVDGPFAEAKDVVGGYLVLEAEDLAHAVELSKGCPILERGGSVEVRPILKLSR